MFRSKKTFGGAVVMGDESIMVSHKEFCTPLTGRSGVVSHVFVSVILSLQSPKSHGTSNVPVQQNLRWGCDRDVADRICNYNR